MSTNFTLCLMYTYLKHKKKRNLIFTKPPLALAHHGPLVSHSGAAIMPSPALVTPAGSPASGHPGHSQHPPSAPNPPCSTLFIANLGHNVAEQEIKEIFSRMGIIETKDYFMLSHIVYRTVVKNFQLPITTTVFRFINRHSICVGAHK
ncbi:hypothetical protein Avbf_03813 [Armadillidium vulgare]|nr:hypothetical protein Avbf_03813 [Armadillidium vulgare]